MNTTGQVNNNNAINANWAAQDCGKWQRVVSRKAEARPSRQGVVIQPQGEQIAYDADGPRAGFDRNSAVDYSVNTVKEKVCCFESLYRAMLVCKRGVMWKDSVAGFVKNGIVNCSQLELELMRGTYKISPYNIFTIHEKKTRTIVSPRIRDRVFQRSLCDNYLTRQISRGFIYDNCACLPGKGTDFARRRLECHLQRFFRRHGLNGYALKVDIHDFFGSTPHDVAKAAVRKRVDDAWTVDRVEEIIDSFVHISPDRGMGLGSQITQLVQLAVLDDMDHYIKERLGIKGFVRYNDDFILLHESKEYLVYCLSEIKRILGDIGLVINDKKTAIQPIRQGIHFLGFSFRLTETGKVIKTVLHKKISKERKKLRKIANLVKTGRMSRKKADDCLRAHLAHIAKGDCHELTIRTVSFYKSLYNTPG